jgi:Uma2 family endonuclease
MPTVASLPEQRVVLRNVKWETYERILEDHLDCSAPRFTYDQGVLEIMSPSAEHEWYNELVSDLVKLIARELRIDVLSLGSTTFKSASAKQGFEPDSCFYVTRIREVRGKERLDMAVDPPPVLVMEVVVTHPSVSKFPLYAELGIPEIWTYDGSRLAMYQLHGRQYVEIPASRVLRELSSEQLSEFLELGKTLDSLAWPDEVLSRFRRSR